MTGKYSESIPESDNKLVVNMVFLIAVFLVKHCFFDSVLSCFSGFLKVTDRKNGVLRICIQENG